MDVNYILIKGNKHFKCHSLAEMAIYFGTVANIRDLFL